MNSEILKELYIKYQQEIYFYLYSMCRNSELAKDLTHDVFVKAILSLADSHTNMRAWLYMVARNEFINYHKKHSKVTYIDDENISLEEHPHEHGADIENMLIFDENKKQLYHLLRHLSEQKREVLILQYFAELSQSEIAKLLNITPENVRIISYRAKQEIKKMWR